MARFHVVPKSPYSVQFWLLGLDARHGLLTRRGFTKSPAPIGSSFYQFGPLRLHSSGFTLRLPEGELEFCRRCVLFWLDGEVIDRQRGFDLSLPAFAEYEAWVVHEYGPGYRAAQFAAHKLPPPVRPNLALWRELLGERETAQAA
ncbi:hypothetical protein ACINK0_03730 [Deinococcus sp. VB343]|uniref:hypothetical protein n=1 Tax=Deinococcus sp. VB343 TaxID=3385567 RepID=UPI0039C90C89